MVPENGAMIRRRRTSAESWASSASSTRAALSASSSACRLRPPISNSSRRRWACTEARSRRVRAPSIWAWSTCVSSDTSVWPSRTKLPSEKFKPVTRPATSARRSTASHGRSVPVVVTRSSRSSCETGATVTASVSPPPRPPPSDGASASASPPTNRGTTRSAAATTATPAHRATFWGRDRATGGAGRGGLGGACTAPLGGSSRWGGRAPPRPPRAGGVARTPRPRSRRPARRPGRGSAPDGRTGTRT